MAVFCIPKAPTSPTPTYMKQKMAPEAVSPAVQFRVTADASPKLWGRS